MNYPRKQENLEERRHLQAGRRQSRQLAGHPAVAWTSGSPFERRAALEIPRAQVMIARPCPATTAVKTRLIASADPERLETWVRYSNGLCRDCQATCCTLPVEVRIDDLIRLQLVDEFERDEPAKQVARRLSREGVVEHFNQKHGLFTLTRMANGDCLFLDTRTRLCKVYDKRPDTCRNHPRIGPRPGHCAYVRKAGR